jgi:curved DNA-binding protein CbpA
MRRPFDVDLYAVLGVTRSATRDEIRAAYRRLVRTAHPDAGGDPAGFTRIAEAWEVLGDASARDRYDVERRLRRRAERGYSPRLEREPAESADAPAPAQAPHHDDDGLSDAERWRRHKRRF